MRLKIIFLVVMLLVAAAQLCRGEDPGGFAPGAEQLKALKGAASGDEASAAKSKTRLTEEDHGPAPDAAVKGTDSLSSFEMYVRGKAGSAVSMDIEQFGYDIFTGARAGFAPARTLPVGPDYLLGPGDELVISFWKKFTAVHNVTIDREGKANIPRVGMLHLAGLTYAEAKAFIEKELFRYYRSGEVMMNVSMGTLRSIRVFVVGKVKRPGSYTVSSMSTLVSALFASGGPDKTGSMRDIQIRRSGEVIAHFDMYDFLLRGDKSADVRLMPEDVIFVPSVGPLAAVAGSVTTPAAYEMKGRTTLAELVEMAGGVSAGGYLHRVQLERIEENRARVILDVDFENLLETENIYVRDGDIVRVFPINSGLVNSIELRGSFARPGAYEWKEGVRVRDIITSTDDLLPDTLLDFVIIERLVPPDNHSEYLAVDLRRLLISGEESGNITLKPHDVITAYNRWEVQDKRYVRVEGAVNRPAKYEFKRNMRVSDLVKLAGGLKRFAYTQGAELTRVTPTPAGPETEKITVDLDAAVAGQEGHDLALEEDDYLFIRTVPEWELYRTVTVTGEVRFPGTYTIMKGERLSSLIERAGGFTANAYLKGAVFTRESVKELQQKRLDEAIDRLELELLGKGARKVESALSADAVEQDSVAIEQRRLLIEKMRRAKAMGRISIRLAEAERLKGTSHDITLENKDTLTVPDVPVQVQVLGEVYNQNAFVYEPKATVSYYLKSAGGMTREADGKSVYVLKVDGTAVSKSAGAARSMVRWDSDEGGWFSGGFSGMRLDPGDTIYVPARLEKVAWLREAKDITQILYQIAVTAGVLIVAF